MTGYLVEHRIRIRNRADNANLLTITSERGGSNPYLKEPPTGDGQGFNPLSSESMAGSYTVRVVDAVTSGTDRIVTANMEDVNQHFQLGYLKCYIESRLDGGTYAGVMGYVTGLRLVSDAEWELTVQDPKVVYDGFELFNATSTQTISSFLAAWPNRGCLIGGPIMGSFLGGTIMPDYGGWTMRVHRITSLGHLRYWLEPVTIYGPGTWQPGRTDKITAQFASTMNEAVRTLPRGVFEPQNSAVSTVADAYARAFWWTGLMHLIDGAVFRPIPPAAAGVNYSGEDSYGDIVGVLGNQRGLFAYDDGQNLSEGAIVRVRTLTVLPSEMSPILLDRHPVDHLTDCWTLAGLSYNSAACTTLKQTIGTGLRHAMIIKGSRKMGDHLKEAAFQFGIATRTNTSGEIVPFSTRIFPNTVPTKTITDALVVEGTTKAFDIDATEGLQRVTLKQKVFTPLSDASNYGILEGDLELTLNNGAANPMVSGTLDLTTAGMLRSDPSSVAPVDINYMKGIAGPLFDRFGEGNPRFATDLIRGDGTSDADTANLGDEYLVNVKQIPNHNKRYGDDNSVGARALQIIQITELTDRRRIVMSDSGPNANALSTKPTHTIAASSDLPRTVAELTITNAATLNGASYAIRVQMAVTTGSAPATTDYHDVYTSTAGSVPTGVIRLPAVLAGYKVYARARSEKFGSRPSDWSTGVSVTLTAITAASSLTATPTPGDGSLCDLAWTVGDATVSTDIYVRAFGAAFSTAIKKATLLPGSTSYRMRDLVASTHYTATVQHRDTTTQDVAAVTEVSFTTTAVVRVLAVPTNPDGFSFPFHVKGTKLNQPIVDDGIRYGLAVVAQEYPGDVEVAESVEDSVGAGTYGAYATVGRVPSVSGDWTIWTRLAPNDSLKRKLKARHVDGDNAGAYCDEVIIDTTALDPVAALPISIANLREKTRNSTTVTMQWENVGTGIEIDVWVTTATLPVASDQWPSTATAPTYRLTAATTEYDFTVPDPNTITYVVIAPIAAGAVIGVPKAFTIQPPSLDGLGQGVIAISSAGACTLAIDMAEWVQSFKWSESTSDYPTDATVRASGTTVNSRQSSVALSSTLALAGSVYVTVLPYSATSAGGVEGSSIRFKATRHDATATKTVFGVFRSLMQSPGSYNTKWSITSGYIACTDWSGDTIDIVNLEGVIVIPDGTTLTGMSVDFYQTSVTSGYFASAVIYRIGTDGTTTSVMSVTADTTGWQTKTATASESTTGRRYQLFLQLYFDYVSSLYVGPTAGQMRASTYSYTYTMPSTVNAI